jgi:hypothetical protein
MVNKKGWVRLVEVFVAVMLIIGLVLIIVSNRDYSVKDYSEEIYESQFNLLREIQTDDSFRTEILNSVIPLESEDFSTNLEEKIDSVEGYDCVAKICDLNSECEREIDESEIFVRTIAITSSLNKYDSRQLKLFCW